MGGNTLIWDYHTCKKIASQYTIKADFRKKEKNVYNASCRQGFMNEICSHMFTKKHIPYSYWTLKNVIIESKKHDTITKFKKLASGAYKACVKNGWLDLNFGVINHMKNLNTRLN